MNRKDQNWYVYLYKNIQKSERATKVHICILRRSQNFCKISTVDLSYVVTLKSKVEISQNCVAFSEYINFINILVARVTKVKD